MPLLRLQQRTPRELLVDSALTLALYHICSVIRGSEGQVGDRLKSAKLLFHAAYPCYQERIKAFSFTFQKYTHGPFTRELYETWGGLEWAGLLEVPSGPSQIVVTPKGRSLAESFLREVLSSEENHSCVSHLIDTAVTFARKSTRQILDETYTMQVVVADQSGTTSIRDLPDDTILTERLESSDATSEVHIPEEWLIRHDIDRKISLTSGTAEEELARLHSPELIKEMEEAIAEYDRGEGRPLTRRQLLEELRIG